MKIRNQLFLILLSLGIVFVLLFSILTYFQGKKILLKEIYDNLEALSQSKKIDLEEIRKLQVDKLNILRSRIKNTELKTHSRSKIDSLLKEFTQIIVDFKDIYIVNKSGIIINASDPSIYNNSEKKSIIETILPKYDNKRIRLILNSNNQLRIVNILPLTNKEDHTEGFLIVEFSTESLSNLTHDYTGLGKTGETIILQEREAHSMNILPTRFNKKALLNLKIPYKDPSYDFNTLATIEGVYKIKDYRGKMVVASIRQIPNSNWILITKIDEDEINAEIYPFRNFLLIFNLAFIIASFIMAYALGRYLAKPIEELINSTNKFKEGDLHARVKSNYSNELGQLSESFNLMADKLERKINDLDKVGYVISHDLKAPLNSIIPLTDFIKEENKENELKGESYEMLNMIKEKSLQMKNLISEVLNMAKSEKMIKEHVDIDSLVSNIISNLSPPPSIQLFIQDNLPIVYYHKVSLMQVFQNLLQNSIKYMNKDKGLIKLGFSENKDEYKFWVMDNGPGIKKKDQQRIFKMFENIPVKTSTESTGIGMAVVKKIISDNKGKIWLESKEGEGCTVYFTIPKPN